MLGTATTFASFSVDDVQRAKEFYGDTLGLEVVDQMGGLELRLGGGASAFAYPKPDHAPATFTILNFLVDDVDEAVDRLTAAGVAFERYEGEIATDEKGVHRDDEGPTIAWFRDPAGNILSVLSDPR